MPGADTRYLDTVDTIDTDISTRTVTESLHLTAGRRRAAESESGWSETGLCVAGPGLVAVLGCDGDNGKHSGESDGDGDGTVHRRLATNLVLM